MASALEYIKNLFEHHVENRETRLHTRFISAISENDIRYAWEELKLVHLAS
jgi:hypothetical protein